MTQPAPGLFGPRQNLHRPKSFASTVSFHLFSIHPKRQAGNCPWSMNHTGIFPLPFPIWMLLPWTIPRWMGTFSMRTYLDAHWHLAGGGLCLSRWAPATQECCLWPTQDSPRILQAVFWELPLLLTGSQFPPLVGFTLGVLGTEGVRVGTASQALLPHLCSTSYCQNALGIWEAENP